MSTLEQAHETIRELYRGLLDREGDAGGVSAHGANLHAGAPLHRLIGDFLRTTEFQQRQSERLISGFLRKTAGGDEVVNHVLSLGIACFTASILRRGGLRHFSGPFDWLFGSPAMVEHILADDFATLLDPRQLVAHPPFERGGAARCQHLYYRDVCGFPDSKPVFNHHNPLEARDRAYFERCIGRLRRLLRGNSGSLLLQLTSVLPDSPERFRSLASVIDRAAPAAHLCVVAITAPTGRLTPGAAVWDRAGKHKLLYFEPVTAMGDLGFPDPFDELVLLRAATSGFRLDLQPDR